MASKPPLVAVGYVRMSSELQRKSPEQQREHVLKLAAKLGCTIIRWYEDLAISGDDTRRRTAFRQMIADASKKKDFSLILCWSQDRFGRFDSIDAGEWVAPLRRSGVRLITVTEGEFNWMDPAGRLIYSIQQEGKNTFLLDMARTSTRGRYLGAQRGGCYAGRLLYGYDKLVFDERGRLQRRLTQTDTFRRPENWTVRLVPSSNTIAVSTVRWMFRAYVNGLSVRAIAHRLNERGIPSALNRHWRRTTVRNMLRNPVYTGDQVWNRLHTGKHFGVIGGDILGHSVIAEQDGKQVSFRRNRKEDWVVVKNAHPALVSRRLFRRVQARLEQRKGRPFQSPGFALTGLVFCAHCGASMHTCPYRQAYNRATYFYRRFVCPTSRDKGRSVCSPRAIDEPRLLTFVLRMLHEHVLDAQFEDRLRAKLQSELGESSRERPGEARRLSREIEKLDLSIDRGTANLLRVKPSQMHLAAEKLSQWQSKRTALAVRVAEIEAVQPRNVNRIVAETMHEVRRLQFGLAGHDRFQLHHILRQLISRITLWFEPNPGRIGWGTFSRGLVVVRVPLPNAKFHEESIGFTFADLGGRCPPGGIAWRKKDPNAAADNNLSANNQSAQNTPHFRTLCRMQFCASQEGEIPPHLA